MGKTHWTRVILGGLLAGIILNILGLAVVEISLRDFGKPAVGTADPEFQETIGFWIFSIGSCFIIGILAVWLYSAIRPRYGPGAKTALVAGLAVWIPCGWSFAAISASFGLFPSGLPVIDVFTFLVILIVATLAGAWIYKE